MALKTQILIYLILFGLLDIVIPIPITVLVLIFVLFRKPVWFRQWVDQVYRG